MTTSVSETTLKKPHLLVADDSALARKIMARQLSQAGYEVHEAQGGASALLRLIEEPVDLVIMDFIMEPMNGLEVLQRIRRIRTPLQLPVLMMSATRNPESVLRATDMGANDFLLKPFSFELLNSKIKLHLKLREETGKTGK